MPRSARPVRARRAASMPMRAVDQLAGGVLAEDSGRQPQQTIDQRRLQPPVDRRLDPQHGEALHDLDAGHRQPRRRTSASAQNDKLVELRCAG